MYNFDELLTKTLMDCKVNPVDGSITGYLDTEEGFKDLMTNIQASGHFYSIRGSHLYRRPSLSKPLPESADENPSEERDGAKHKSCNRKTRKNIHFRSQQGAVPISFFGSPFSIVRNTYFECSQGPKYYKNKISKENVITECGVRRAIQRRNRTSKKMNCPALILIKCIRVYPEFSTNSPREPHWKLKKEITTKINDAVLSNSSPQSFLRYFIKASPQKSHSHETDANKSKRLLAAQNLKRERRRKYKLARKLRMKAEGSVESPGNHVIGSGEVDFDEEFLETKMGAEEYEVQLEEEVLEKGVELTLAAQEEQVNDTEKEQHGLGVPMEEDINELLFSLQKEAQKIVNLSSSCSNIQTLSHSLALLQEASRLLEEPPQEPITAIPGTKTISIPVQQVYTNSSENYFTFTLDQATNPTCVVFVQ